jgi:hypothetical protein
LEVAERDHRVQARILDRQNSDLDHGKPVLVHKSYEGREVIALQGHSLGGAYATLFWASLLATPPPVDATIRDLITFGSPRVGDRTFVDSVKRLKGKRRSWRFMNGYDIVTSLPIPTGILSYEYIHIDTLVRIAPDCIARGESEVAVKSWIETLSHADLDMLYWMLVETGKGNPVFATGIAFAQSSY